MKRSTLVLVAVWVALCGATGSAQRGTATRVPAEPSGVRFMTPYKTARDGGETRVIGTVIDIRQVPVAKVRVRLRDLNSGNVLGQAESDDQGRYFFPAAEPGTYVVEMFIGDRYVIALSNAGTVGRSETLQTVVQLPGRWDTARQSVITPTNVDFLGRSSVAATSTEAIAAAASQGVPPVTPGEPVSPVR